MKISAIILAKNEEDMIADCIDSVDFCDEVIVVDNDSNDRTAEIAERMGATIVKEESDDFSLLRNAGLKKAREDFVFYVDADERVDDSLRESIKENIGKDFSCFKVKRQNFYLGNNPWPKIEIMERLFRKEDLIGWRGKLHETPEYKGSSFVLEGFLLHYTHRNLSQMLSKTIEWSEIEARNRFEAGHPKMTWWRFPRVMITTFINYYFIQKGFKVGTVGLIESIYQSFSTLITYAKLWELQNNKNS